MANVSEEKKRTPKDMLTDSAAIDPNQCMIVFEHNGQLKVEISFKTLQDALLMNFVLDKQLKDLINANLKRE
jgi:hypothetical protein